MNMYIIKIYRKDTAEAFVSMPIFADSAEQAKKEALEMDNRKQEIVKIEVV
jgi:hypothetical protein